MKKHLFIFVALVLVCGHSYPQFEIKLDSILTLSDEFYFEKRSVKESLFGSKVTFERNRFCFEPHYIERKKFCLESYYFSGFDTSKIDSTWRMFVSEGDSLFVKKLPKEIFDKANFLCVAYRTEVFFFNIVDSKYLFNFNLEILSYLKNFKLLVNSRELSLFRLMNHALGFTYGSTF